MRNTVQKQTLLIQERDSAAGFSLLELLVGMAVFMVISAAAFSLVAYHLPVFNQQQNLAEVNIALRNAIAQLQLDVANAGANYYAGVNVPNYPVGVVVTNNVGAGDCRSGTPLAYGVNCFDSLSIITADAATPPTNPSDGSGGCAFTNGTTLYLAPAGGAGYASSAASTAAAGHYLNGDQILLVKNDGSQYTTVKLSHDGQAQGSPNYYVKLTFGSTDSTGLNDPAGTNDVYGMTTHANGMLYNQFCPANSYLLRITPIQYKVDLTNPSNPVLTRTVAGTTMTLSQQTLATQIIGFKLGVSLYNNTTDTDTTTYSFDASTYDNGSPVHYNYTLVRSLMISLIGRTTPSTDPTYVFRNSFDSGAYEIQGVTAVINPRNMSMSD
jgi:type II secretory pathway pseudopilin PulG